MRIVLADNHEQRIEHTRRILLGEGLTCDVDDVVDYHGLPGRLAGGKVDLVMVTVNGACEEALAAIRAAHEATEVPILAADAGTEPEIIRQAVRAGAREFLNLDRLREELADVLGQIEAAGGVPNERGVLISMFSPSGGAGVSTLATNLAARLAADMPDRVALIDLKPAPSDMALLLDFEPKHTLEEVCRSWDRLDAKMLGAAMARHDSGLRVLAQAGYPESGSLPENTLTVEAVRQLCSLTRRMYAVTVADLSSRLDAPQVETLRLSSLVGLVVRTDVPGLHRARWAIDRARALGVPEDRLRLVLNRFGQRGQVDPSKVEELLGVKVFHRVPDDSRSVNKAVNRGIPVTAASRLSRISRSFSSLARKVQTSCGKVTG
ncbi:MAG: nucleotide-binding protein [Planctomycetota bacterium]|jgi:pilus assembly protein CpaE